MKSLITHADVCLGGLLALTLLIGPGYAEDFERDWKESGDGLLTYDNVNNREWLDLSETLLEQFAEPGAEFPGDHYANVVAELGPGGLFEGFTVAKSEDVIELAESAGIDPADSSYEVNGEPMERLMNLIDVTLILSGTTSSSVGFLDEFVDLGNPECPCRSTAFFQVRLPAEGFPGQALLVVGGHPADLTAPSNAGVMLYRIAIPEPSSLILVCACISTIGFTAYREEQRGHSQYCSARFLLWAVRERIGCEGRLRRAEETREQDSREA